jgi:outer membrane protein assembly factor BamD
VLNGNRIIIRIVFIGIYLLFVGCASKQDELGAEIRKTLGVKKDTLKKTENSIERNYDPKVILKRAEAYYEKGDYIEAIGEYQRFMDLHPYHEWADYALFKLGISYFQQMRTIDRDPEPIQKALETFQKLLSVYPQTQYAEEANKKIRVCQEALADHQLYVGHFYYKKAAYLAAIARFMQLLETYPDLPQTEEALYFLGLAYYYHGEADEASTRLEELLDRYPKTPHRKEAQQLLARINGTSTP